MTVAKLIRLLQALPPEAQGKPVMIEMPAHEAPTWDRFEDVGKIWETTLRRRLPEGGLCDALEVVVISDV